MKRALLFVAGAAVGLIVLAPAALVLPAPPLTASGVTGSVWSAAISNAAIGPLRLGDVAISLQPAALAQGRMGWGVEGAITGQIWRGFAAGGATGLNGRVLGSPIASVPIAGVSLADAGATLDGAGRCVEASGQVVADLATPVAGQRQLAGAVRCDGDALLLPLASSDGRVRIDLATTRRQWTARLVVAGASTAEVAALGASGFRSEAGALVKEETGSW